MAINGFVIKNNLLKHILAVRRPRTEWSSHLISPLSNFSTKQTSSKFDMSKFVTNLGYPIETYEDLKTGDGYFLTMYRIPHGKTNKTDPQKVPVLLMHGLGRTGFHWVSGGPQHSYAFLLADDGYDVWIGNSRGTPYSKKHEHYDPEKNPETFWDFSWHDIGYYDLYTKINHIVEKTNQSQIIYMGHGQGTTCFFVLMSMRPEMNEKVKLMVGFAPGVFAPKEFVMKPESVALDMFHQIDVSRRLQGIHMMTTQMKEVICHSPFSTKTLCDVYSSVILSMTGVDRSKIRPEHYQLLSQTFPVAGSAKQFLHYFQVTLTGDFTQYHLGESENFKKYRSDTPSKYNISRTTAPVLLFVATLKGGKRIAALVKNDVDLQAVLNTSHMDFLVSDDSVKLVFSKMNPILSNYLNTKYNKD